MLTKIDFLKAAEDGNIDRLRECLDQGMDIESKKNDNGQTALYIAVKYKKYEAVHFLLANRANPKIREVDGWTPLYRAAADNDTEMIKLLVKNDASLLDYPNGRSTYENCPLHGAAFRGNIDAIKTLVMQGANPYTKNTLGWDVFYYIKYYAKDLSNNQKQQLIEFIKDVYPLLNPVHEYTEDELNCLLQLQLKDGKDAHIYSAQYPFIQGTMGLHAAEIFQDIIRQATITNIPSLIPINCIEQAELDENGLPRDRSVLLGTHWILLVIEPLNDSKYQLTLIDSYGNGLNENKDITGKNLLDISDMVPEDNMYRKTWERAARIVGLMEGLIRKDRLNISYKMQVAGLNQQDDAVNCGPYLVQNGVDWLQKHALKHYNPDMLREWHAELLQKKTFEPNLSPVNLALSNPSSAKLKKTFEPSPSPSNLAVSNPSSIKSIIKTKSIINLSSSYIIPSSAFKISKDNNNKSIKLGSGGFGTVYKGKWQYVDVAIKKLKIKIMTDKALGEFKRETEIMAGMTHPNVIRLNAVCIESGNYCMLMEYMPKGSLYHVLHSTTPPAWPIRWQIALDIGKGIVHLHHKHILHRDLKSLNVLLDINYQAKVSDFGLSLVKKETESLTLRKGKRVGTPAWMAPEVIEGKGYTKACDIYGLGMIFWELAACKLPYENFIAAVLIINHVQQGKRETIPTDTPPSFAKLIERCWAQRAEDRPTIEEVVQELDDKQAEANIQFSNSNFAI